MAELFLEFQKLYRRLDGDQDIPAFLNFEIRDLPDAMFEHLTLIGVEYQPLRFRYQIMGSEAVKAFGLDMTGRYIDENPLGAESAIAMARLQAIAENGKPIIGRRHFTPNAVHRAQFDIGGFPFLGIDGMVERIILLILNVEINSKP